MGGLPLFNVGLFSCKKELLGVFALGPNVNECCYWELRYTGDQENHSLRVDFVP